MKGRNSIKKALSLILAISLIFCALPVMGISAEETASDKFTVTSSKVETTTISGDDVSGYTMEVTGTGSTRVMTKETYPMKNLSFDFGYMPPKTKYRTPFHMRSAWLTEK